MKTKHKVKRATNDTNYIDVIKDVLETREYELSLNDGMFTYHYVCDGGDDIFGDGIEITFGVREELVKFTNSEWELEDYLIGDYMLRNPKECWMNLDINTEYICDVNCEIAGDTHDWCDSYISEATYHNTTTDIKYAREMTCIEIEYLSEQFVYKCVNKQLY